MENLGFWVIHNGFKPLNQEEISNKNMTPTTTWKGVIKCIGLDNYYIHI